MVIQSDVARGSKLTVKGLGEEAWHVAKAWQSKNRSSAADVLLGDAQALRVAVSMWAVRKGGGCDLVMSRTSREQVHSHKDDLNGHTCGQRSACDWQLGHRPQPQAQRDAQSQVLVACPKLVNMLATIK